MNGGGLLGWSILGKRVSFLAKDSINGSWAEVIKIKLLKKIIIKKYFKLIKIKYVVADAVQCITHVDTVSFESAAFGLVRYFIYL